ncbi:MAG: FAD-dependent oxidoreductase [SAR324 cluster bacterium]|nr:FAD-dependent oxidoreductase [SAR324 cluster bacterium]
MEKKNDTSQSGQAAKSGFLSASRGGGSARKEKFNLVILGGGSAGLMTAAGAAGLGARVALVEPGKMGGDCLNYGCVPSKALLRCARDARAKREGRFGSDAVDGAKEFSADWEAVAAWVRGAIGAIAPHDSVERFQSLGVEVVAGKGRVTGPHSVRVELNAGGSRELEGRALVIATGSSPLVPAIPGLEAAGYLTNETVFSQSSLPRRLLVMGGGPIGVELSQAFARLGSQVTLVEMLPRILQREDADAAELVAKSLERDGVEILTSTRVIRVEGGPGEKSILCQPSAGAGGGGANGATDAGANGATGAGANDATDAGADAPSRTVKADEILVAAGRRANLADLGLEAAGIRTGGGLVLTDRRMRTSLRSVYACGDVTGPYPFTHMAGQQARVVIQNALLPFKTRMDYRVAPWATFTDPELARVGLNEEDATAQGVAHRIIKLPFSGNDRAVCDGETGGFLKILTPPGKDDILGATLVGPHAGELLHEVVLAMQAKLRLRDIANTIHIYPTLAEIFRRAGDESRKASFTPLLRRMFAAYLRWQRR